MGASLEATPKARKGLRARLGGHLVVLVLFLAGIGIWQVFEIWSAWGKWTLGDPLSIPSQDQVTKVEIRRWNETNWIEVPLPASKRLLDALAKNNELIWPKHGGPTCYLPVRAEFEIRVHTRSGLPMRLALSGGCYGIEAAATEGPEGRVPEHYSRGWDWKTWTIRDDAQRVIFAEISAALPAPPAPEDK